MSANHQMNHCVDVRGWDSLKKKIYTLRTTMSYKEQTIVLLQQQIKDHKYQQNILITEKARLKKILLDIAANQSQLVKLIDKEVLKLEENEINDTKFHLDKAGTPSSEIVMSTIDFVPYRESIDIMTGNIQPIDNYK